MKKLTFALCTATLLQSAAPAFAIEPGNYFDFTDKERWIIRARVIDIDPDVDSNVTGLAAWPVNSLTDRLFT